MWYSHAPQSAARSFIFLEKTMRRFGLFFRLRLKTVTIAKPCASEIGGAIQTNPKNTTNETE